MPDANALEIAQLYTSAGLSVLPVRIDGSKAAAEKWEEYKKRIATDRELERWYRRGRNGIAIVCGAVSGNLAVFDFDAPGAWTEFRGLCDDHDLLCLVDQFPLVKTPRDGDGRHMYVRVEGAVGGSDKLAMLRDPYYDSHGKKHYVKIETKGEGGYVLAPGSPDACHEDNRPYILEHGNLTDIPVITTDQYKLLRTISRMCDERAIQIPGVTPTATTGGQKDRGTRPGDDFNARGEVGSLLRRHGWTLTRSGADEEYWIRPGKKKGISATFNYKNSRAFKVFTTNAPPFEADKAYAPFAVYTLLEHSGDFTQSAAALKSQGYGSDSAPQTMPLPGLPVAPVAQPLPNGTEGEPILRYPLRPESYFDSLPDVEWLIDDILPKECFAVLFGEPESGKTFVALDWSFSIASGIPWMGRRTAPGYAVYIVAESPRGVKARKDAWKQARGIGELPLWRGIVGSPDLVSIEDTMHIITSLRTLEEPPALVVVDTLSKCFIGNENATEDMQKFTRHCLGFVQEVGCTVVALHHMDKGGEKERGSSTLRGDADVLIPLRKQDASRIVLGGRGTKQKEAPAFDPIHLRFQECGPSRVLAPTRVRKALTPNEEQIIAILTTEGPLGYADIRRETVNDSQQEGMAKSSLKKALDSLADQRWVTFNGTEYSLNKERWSE